jgi:mxaA protein
MDPRFMALRSPASSARRLATIWISLAWLIASPLLVLAETSNAVVKSIVIRAPRDIGFFAGDLVKADIDLVVADGYAIEPASLPHPGPIDYWLDLRSIDVEDVSDRGERRYRLKLLYQNFYDALDARPQAIPTFTLRLVKGGETVTADIPAWNIGVSPLREIAPPVQDDPKDYMRADADTPMVKTQALWRATILTALASLAALALLAHDRAWWPFLDRPARVFASAGRRLRKLEIRSSLDEAYLEGLLILHRGIDQTDGRRVLADDLPDFLLRHPGFAPLAEGFAHFFKASRLAFFASDPARSRAILSFAGLEAFARKLAAAERARP